MARRITLLLAWALLFGSPALAQPPRAAFDASKLVKLGDEVKYGSYLVRRIGDGAYQINDPGDQSTKGGGWGVDMYLVCGTRKALLIDLGNNYIAGYEKDALKPRPNAVQEFLAVVDALVGGLSLEVAVTHMHPDHDGMAGAFAGRKVPMWAGDGEDLSALKNQHDLDPSIFRTFKPGATSFDLGGGHLVETLPVRGHSNGGTVYLLKNGSLVFSGDALGSGFGQAFGTVERLKQVAEDSRNLVDYIKVRYAPYQRYALRVYTGHSWQNTYGGFLHPNKASLDIGYLDWRFIQDVAACANGILQGKWLVEGSGIKFMGTMVHTDAWGSAAGRAIMVSGTGTIILPLEVAYQAAGLPMPTDGPGGVERLDPSVKRTPVQAGKAAGFLYQPATSGEKARIGVFVMHFGSDYSSFSACWELSRRGYTVLCTRNSGGGLNDILPDARSSVEYLRRVAGVEKVVLWGHSGGATLMTAYQLMAENGVKACQGPEKISKCPESLAAMPAADGMVLADANWGNAVMTLLSIDPAVIDEGDPAKLEEDLNLFNPKNGYNPEGNSHYSPGFIKRWQSAVGRRNNALITSMSKTLAALGPESSDDRAIVVYGANSMGPNNKLFPQDVTLMAHTVKPWPLIHADGSVTTQVVHSVRVPSGKPSSPQDGALTTTARRYLTDNAVRVTSGFGYDASSLYGVEWASSYASTPGNVEQIRIPSLFIGMTGGYEYLAAETIYEHSAARDKSLAFVEGASHDYRACRQCETTPGQFGDTIKTLYDYVDRWLGQKGRF